MCHVFHNRLLANSFLYSSLSLHIERIGIQSLNLALLLDLRFCLPLPRLTQ